MNENANLPGRVVKLLYSSNSQAKNANLPLNFYHPKSCFLPQKEGHTKRLQHSIWRKVLDVITFQICPKTLTTQNDVFNPKIKVTHRIFSNQYEEWY